MMPAQCQLRCQLLWPRAQPLQQGRFPASPALQETHLPFSHPSCTNPHVPFGLGASGQALTSAWWRIAPSSLGSVPGLYSQSSCVCVLATDSPVSFFGCAEGVHDSHTQRLSSLICKQMPLATTGHSATRMASPASGSCSPKTMRNQVRGFQSRAPGRLTSSSSQVHAAGDSCGCRGTCHPSVHSCSPSLAVT